MRLRFYHINVSKDIYNYDKDTTTFEEVARTDQAVVAKVNDFIASLEEKNEYIIAAQTKAVPVKDGLVVVVSAWTEEVPHYNDEEISYPLDVRIVNGLDPQKAWDMTKSMLDQAKFARFQKEVSEEGV